MMKLTEDVPSGMIYVNPEQVLLVRTVFVPSTTQQDSLGKPVMVQQTEIVLAPGRSVRVHESADFVSSVWLDCMQRIHKPPMG
jgi:hypothetical protein